MSATHSAIAMAQIAANAATEKLATDIVIIDVSDQLVITDCFVICSANNERQISAIVDEIEHHMRQAGYKPSRREGTRQDEWILLDYIDIVIHIQRQDTRDFYALERLWKDCPTIPVTPLGYQETMNEPQ